MIKRRSNGKGQVKKTTENIYMLGEYLSATQATSADTKGRGRRPTLWATIIIFARRALSWVEGIGRGRGEGWGGIKGERVKRQQDGDVYSSLYI
jgi:hypothetical protein